MFFFKKDNKGALELSVGTIVIIVIAMSMLILGLVLVRTIFTGATDSVDILNDKVQSEIASLFADEGSDVIVKLGSDQTAKVKAGDGAFGVAIGARTLDGGQTDRNRLQYKLTVEPANGRNCASSIGLAATEDLFVTPVNQFISFDRFQGSNSFALVEVDVPRGTPVCSQKVFIDVIDNQNNNQVVGGNFFRIEILKEGFF